MITTWRQAQSSLRHKPCQCAFIRSTYALRHGVRNIREYIHLTHMGQNSSTDTQRLPKIRGCRCATQKVRTIKLWCKAIYVRHPQAYCIARVSALCHRWWGCKDRSTSQIQSMCTMTRTGPKSLINTWCTMTPLKYMCNRWANGFWWCLRGTHWRWRCATAVREWLSQTSASPHSYEVFTLWQTLVSREDK